MKTAFFYFYCIVAVLLRKINPKQKEFLFSSYTFVTLCGSLNILSIVFLIEYYSNVKTPNGIFVLIALPLWWLNYNILVRNDKDKIIFEEYQAKLSESKNKKVFIIMAILYVLFSFGACYFFATINREKFT